MITVLPKRFCEFQNADTAKNAVVKGENIHLAIVSIGAYGHVNPTLPLTAELVRRGNRVTYFTTEAFRKEITFTGADFVPIESVITNQGKPAENVNEDLIPELPLRFLSEAEV